MYCENCKMEQEGKFCVNCGKELASSNLVGNKQAFPIAKLLGIVSVLLTIISMFVPYAQSAVKKISLKELAMLYINSSSEVWNDKARETFYKIFIPGVLILMILFSLIFLIKCIKSKQVGMIVMLILTVIVYEVLRWDLSDRRIVPSSMVKYGIAYWTIYIAFLIMGISIIFTIVSKVKNKARN